MAKLCNNVNELVSRAPRLRLRDYLMPESCILCGRLSQSLCHNCQELLLSRVRFGTCGACGRVLRRERCVKCTIRLPKVRRAVALGPYKEEIWQQLIIQLKFHNQPSLADWLGRLLGLVIQRELPERPSCLVPIPSSRSRIRERGYNQAVLLAEAINRELAVPVHFHLARQSNLHQVGHSRKERLAQADHFFRLKSEACPRPLLIDDVITTGATLLAAASTLDRRCDAAVVAYDV